jgi:maleate isomerase
MTGAHRVPLPALLPRIAEAAQTLGDAKCDLIVFHCTANSMEAGAAEPRIVATIEAATGRRATTTASAVVQALRALEVRRLALITPYAPETNAHEVAFLAQHDVTVVRDRALNLPPSDGYIAAPERLWLQVAEEERDPRADVYFFSCTNVQTIDLIETLEAWLGRPVVTSNQAVLWYALRICGRDDRVPGLGTLLERAAPVVVA